MSRGEVVGFCVELGKDTYASKKAARKAVRGMKERTGVKAEPYGCNYCGGVHVRTGSKPRAGRRIGSGTSHKKAGQRRTRAKRSGRLDAW